MEISPAEVEHEHRLALAMLTPEQVAALNRLWRAHGSPRCGPGVLEENLNRIYATEAEIRSTEGAGFA